MVLLGALILLMYLCSGYARKHDVIEHNVICIMCDTLYYYMI